MNSSAVFFIATIFMSILSGMALSSRFNVSDKSSMRMMRITVTVWIITILLFIGGY